MRKADIDLFLKILRKYFIPHNNILFIKQKIAI